MDGKKYPLSSKFLSLILRHRPELINLELDAHGWTSVPELIEKLHDHGKIVNMELLEHIVETNEKKRFSFNPDKSRIRASQGHSVRVELGYEPSKPPGLLYHGTGKQSVDSILSLGIKKRNRHHVHLSSDIPTARNVGQRHGKPGILEVLSGNMDRDGYQFYLSENGIWLVDEVPVKYINLLF